MGVGAVEKRWQERRGGAEQGEIWIAVWLAERPVADPGSTETQAWCALGEQAGRYRMQKAMVSTTDQRAGAVQCGVI